MPDPSTEYGVLPPTRVNREELLRLRDRLDSLVEERIASKRKEALLLRNLHTFDEGSRSYSLPSSTREKVNAELTSIFQTT